MNVRKFPHLKHPASHVLLQTGTWSKGGVEWQLFTGSFLETFRMASLPDVVYYDPYSYKTNHEMWSVDAFEAIHRHVGSADVEFYSYTASTRVRAAMLASGFFVASGQASGVKTETTVALTKAAAYRYQSSWLSDEWLKKWNRSQAKWPDGYEGDLAKVFERHILQHEQFSSLS
jgi:queuine tRNA-ribosyltransferase